MEHAAPERSGGWPGRPGGWHGWAAGWPGRAAGWQGRPGGWQGRAGGWPGWRVPGYGPVRRTGSPVGDRWRRWVILPVAVAVFQIIGSSGAQHGQPAARPLDAVGYALLSLGAAALVLLHRYPVPALVATEAATLGYALAGYAWGPSFVAFVVAVFGAARAGRWAAIRWAIAAGYLSFALLAWAASASWLPRALLGTIRPHAAVPDLVAVGGWLLLLLAIVEANRVRWRYREEMVRISDERERAREEQERREAIQERLRIARELHDVLGHHLSLISVQAGVGLHLMDERPEQARDALVAIRAASAEALREVRGVLAALRPAEESAPRSPVPSLDNLDALVADAGFDVHVEITGTRRQLPPEVDRAGYRIVQEALTNVRRHAGPDPHARVRIGYTPNELSLTIEDDGPATGTAGTGMAAGKVAAAGTSAGTVAAGSTAAGSAVAGSTAAGSTAAGTAAGTAGSAAGGAATHTAGGAAVGAAGNGIPGMRERATALGGSLRAGPRAAGGFTVAARLPLVVQR